jgi:putative transposase
VLRSPLPDYYGWMALALKRYQQFGHLHFVTFSCYQRQPFMETPETRELFEEALERIRRRNDFQVIGYVVMPEHVHLLVREPGRGSLATAIQAVKLSVVRRMETHPFWLARYYDFNLFTESKRTEKLDYMHFNPVKRGLVEKMEQWPWSSYRSYCTGETARVQVELAWAMRWDPANPGLRSETWGTHDQERESH